MNKKVLFLIFLVFICTICCCIVVGISIFVRTQREDGYILVEEGSRIGNYEYYFAKNRDMYQNNFLNIVDNKNNRLLEDPPYIEDVRHEYKYKVFNFRSRDIMILISKSETSPVSSGFVVRVYQVDSEGVKEIKYSDFETSCDYPEVYEDKIILKQADRRCTDFWRLPTEWKDVEFNI